MIIGIALILIAVFVEMPKAIMITLCVFGGWNILVNVIRAIAKFIVGYNEGGKQ